MTDDQKRQLCEWAGLWKPEKCGGYPVSRGLCSGGHEYYEDHEFPLPELTAGATKWTLLEALTAKNLFVINRIGGYVAIADDWAQRERELTWYPTLIDAAWAAYQREKEGK